MPKPFDEGMVSGHLWGMSSLVYNSRISKKEEVFQGCMQSISVFRESIKHRLASFACLLLFVRFNVHKLGRELGGRVAIAAAPVLLTNHPHRARTDSDVYNFKQLRKIRQLRFWQLPSVVTDLSVGSCASARRVGGLESLGWGGGSWPAQGLAMLLWELLGFF